MEDRELVALMAAILYSSLKGTTNAAYSMKSAVNDAHEILNIVSLDPTYT